MLCGLLWAILGTHTIQHPNDGSSPPPLLCLPLALGAGRGLLRVHQLHQAETQGAQRPRQHGVDTGAAVVLAGLEDVPRSALGAAR